ncbi:MAG: hypothetical protein ACKPKO_06970, partial [Candidatus Fonsibacter sp.]
MFDDGAFFTTSGLDGIAQAAAAAQVRGVPEAASDSVSECMVLGVDLGGSEVQSLMAALDFADVTSTLLVFSLQRLDRGEAPWTENVVSAAVRQWGVRVVQNM